MILDPTGHPIPEPDPAPGPGARRFRQITLLLPMDDPTARIDVARLLNAHESYNAVATKAEKPTVDLTAFTEHCLGHGLELFWQYHREYEAAQTTVWTPGEERR